MKATLRGIARLACIAMLLSGSFITRAQEDYGQVSRAAKQDFESGRFDIAEKGFHHADRDLLTPGLYGSPEHIENTLIWAEALILLGHLDPADQLLHKPWLPGRDPAMKGKTLFLQGQVEGAKGQYDAALAKCKEALNATPEAAIVDRARYLTTRGELFLLKAQPKDSEKALQDALAIETAVGDHARLEHASTLAALGDLERSREKYTEAKARYTEAISILQEPDGEQQPILARARLGSAELALSDYKMDEAQAQLQQALSFWNKLPESPIFASVRDAVGRFYLANGNYDLAKQNLKGAYESRQSTFGDPDTATSLDHLGLLYLAQGDLSAAAESLNKAWNLRKVLPPNHPDLAVSSDHLGILSRKQRQYPTAEGYVRGALRIQTDYFGAESLAVAESQYELANVLNEEQKPEEAERAYRQALDTQSKRLREDHPQRLHTIRSLAVLLHIGHQDVESQQLLVTWMKLHGKTQPDDPDWLEASTVLAEIQLAQTRYADAERTLLSILPVASRSPLLGRIRLALGNALYYQRKYKDAAAIYAMVVVPPLPATIAVANIWQRLGDCYLAQRQPNDAARAYREALEIRTQKVGPSDSTTIASLISLGDSLVESSNLEEADKYLSVFMKDDAPFTPDAVRVIEKLAQSLQSNHISAKAEVYLRRALVFAKQPGAGGVTLDGLLEQLAKSCADQGKYGDAAAFYEQRAHRAANKPREVLKYLQLAEQLREKADGESSLAIVPALQALAEASLNLQKYDDAKGLFERAQRILEKSDHHDDPLLAVSFNGLGRVAQERRTARRQTPEQASALYAEAASFYERAASLLQGRSNTPRRVLADVLCNRGSLALDNDQMTIAEGFFGRCRELFEQAYTPDDPPPFWRLSELADFYEKKRSPKDAETLYLNAAKLSGEVFGKNSVEYGNQLAELAEVYYNDPDRYPDAAPLRKEALHIFEENYGSTSDEVGYALRSLADVYKKMKEVPTAVTYLDRSVSIFRNSGNVEYERITLLELAKDYNNLENYPKAVEAYRDVAELLQREGYKNSSYIDAMIGLAVALEYAKNHDGGRKTFDEVQQGLKKEKKQEDEQKLLKQYADALSRNDHQAEALILMKQVKRK